MAAVKLLLKEIIFPRSDTDDEARAHGTGLIDITITQNIEYITTWPTFFFIYQYTYK